MSLSARKATLVPSGDSTGLPMPTTGLGHGESKSRRRLVYLAGCTSTDAVNAPSDAGPPDSDRLRSAPSELYRKSLPCQETRNGNASSPVTSGWPDRYSSELAGALGGAAAVTRL